MYFRGLTTWKFIEIIGVKSEVWYYYSSYCLMTVQLFQNNTSMCKTDRNTLGHSIYHTKHSITHIHCSVKGHAEIAKKHKMISSTGPHSQFIATLNFYHQQIFYFYA